MFAMVPDAAWPGSYQWPWSTALASGPAGRLGRTSASDPGGVVRCALSLCCPRCVCVCGVQGHLAHVHGFSRPLCSVRGVDGHVARVHWCARCVPYVCGVGGFVGDPPSFLFFSVFVFFFLPLSFCVCSVIFFRVCSSPFVAFFLQKFKLKRGRLHTAGTGMGTWCSVLRRGVRRRCLVGGRSQGARLARLDVRGCGLGCVRLGFSLRPG